MISYAGTCDVLLVACNLYSVTCDLQLAILAQILLNYSVGSTKISGHLVE